MKYFDAIQAAKNINQMSWACAAKVKAWDALEDTLLGKVPGDVLIGIYRQAQEERAEIMASAIIITILEESETFMKTLA